MENNDLVTSRHVQREASLFIQHVPFQRPITHQLNLLFEDHSLLRELIQPRLPLDDLTIELLGRLQAIAAVNGMIAEVGEKGDRDQRHHQPTQFPFLMMPCPHAFPP
ncbi:hypothetical protein D3C71_1856280 [compost metagenome]